MLNAIVKENQNYGLVVNSRDVAVGLKKKHSDVLKSLDSISQDLENKENGNFRFLAIPHEYSVKGQRRKYREYLLTKDGFILYMFNIQGHLDFKLAYIDKFNEMENQLKQIPQKEWRPDLKRQLDVLEDHLAKNAAWQKAMEANLEWCKRDSEECQKCIDILKTVEEKPQDLLVRDYAKVLCDLGYNYNERSLYRLLRANGFVQEDSTEATEKAIKQGLLTKFYKEWGRRDKKIIDQRTKITPKGQEYFLKLFGTQQLTFS